MSPEARLILIEQELKRSDPAFVAAWERRASTPRDVVPLVLTWCLVATAAALLGFGLLTVDRSLVQGAGLVVLCLPIAWLVGVARRIRPSTRSITTPNPPAEPPR